MSDSAEWQAGFQAGLGRLEGFKEAVRLQIEVRYLLRLSAFRDDAQELAALRGFLCAMEKAVRDRLVSAPAHKELQLERFEEALRAAAGKLAVLRLLLAAYPDNALAAECRKHGLDVPP